MAIKLMFENSTCGRCGGSGWYAIGTCYGCAGRGAKLTKRGAAAQAFLNALRQRRLDEFNVGDLWFSQGFAAGSFVEPNRWMRVTRIERGLSQHTVNGQRVDTVTLHGVDIKRGDTSSFSGAPSTTLRKGFTADEKVEQQQMAKEYQATLNRAGRPVGMVELA